MMINKRLIQAVPESKQAVRDQVLLQWGSLIANLIILFTFAFLLEALWKNQLNALRLSLAAVLIFGSLVVRWFCTSAASRKSFEASRSVKQILRRQILEKLLRLGVSYREQTATAEIVQIAVEGVDQLETYFGAYLPQFFYSMLAPLTLFAALSWISLPSALALLFCVPLNSHRDCGCADLCKETALSLLGTIRFFGRQLFRKSARFDNPKNLSGR